MRINPFRDGDAHANSNGSQHGSSQLLLQCKLLTQTPRRVGAVTMADTVIQAGDVVQKDRGPACVGLIRGLSGSGSPQAARPACVTLSVTIGSERDVQDATGQSPIIEPYLA